MRKIFSLSVGILTAAFCSLQLPQAATAADWPTVQEGQTGENVQTLQYLVTHHGHPVHPDGKFGPNTRVKVTDFQRGNSLDTDGVVGPRSWEKMIVEVKSGTTATNAVNAAKVQLNKHGAKLPLNGAFDQASVDAVQKFQTAHRINDTGVVNPVTWRELVATAGPTGGYALPIARGALPRGEYDDPHHDYPALDLPVGSGTRVYAVNGGQATRVAIGGGCGHGLQIRGNDGGLYTYCHFRQPALVSGAVQAGAHIGYSGSTGHSSGPHLHIQLKRSNGTLVCPQRLLLAVYDRKSPPAVGTLPTRGCFY